MGTITAKAGETDLGRRVRAIAFTMLLIGTLLPTVGGHSVAVPAIALAVPLVIYELLGALPRIHPALRFAVPLFAVLALPGLLTPPDTVYGHDKFVRLITFTLLSALAASLVRNPRGLLSVARVWTFVACLLAAITASGHGTIVAGRLSVFDSNPIWLARAFASALIFVAWMLWQRRMRVLLALPLVGLLLVGLYLTGSRGPAIGAVLGVVVLALFANRARTSRIVGVILAAAALAATFAYSQTAATSRLGTFLADPTEGTTASPRYELLQRTIPVIRENPGGVGYGNWQAASGESYLMWPHNLYLELLAEGGWFVGSVLIVALVVVLLRLARRSRMSAEAGLVLALLVAEAFAVSVSGDLNARSFFAFLTLGAVVAKWPVAVGAVDDDVAADPHLGAGVDPKADRARDPDRVATDRAHSVAHRRTPV